MLIPVAISGLLFRPVRLERNMKKVKKRVETIGKFIFASHGLERAPYVNLISCYDIRCSEPFEISIMTKVPLSSWLLAGAMSLMVFMGLNAGQADAFKQQSDLNKENGTRPAHQMPGFIVESIASDNMPHVVASDCVKALREAMPTKVNLINSSNGEKDQRFAHTNVQPHTNILYTDIPWENWTNTIPEINVPWQNIDINPGAAGDGDGILF